MIRINLANALMRTMDAVAKPAAATSAASPENKVMKENILKVSLILLPVIALVFYERSNLSTIQQTLDTVLAEKNTQDQKLAQVGSVDDVLRQIDQQKQEVDRKVGVVRKIFSMRKQKINAITALQTHIPRSTWLQTVEFTGDEIKITGMANTTDEAQSYASLLSQEKDIFIDLKNKETSKADKQEGKPDIFRFEYIGKVKE